MLKDKVSIPSSPPAKHSKHVKGEYIKTHLKLRNIQGKRDFHYKLRKWDNKN
jgi:hypothetical protein